MRAKLNVRRGVILDINVGLHWYQDNVRSHRRTECTFGGERYMNGLRLVNFDFPCVDPYLEDVKVVLKFLRSDDRIRMNRK